MNTLGENYEEVRQTFAHTYAQLKLAGKTTNSKELEPKLPLGTEEVD